MSEPLDPVTEAEDITRAADLQRRADYLANCYPNEPEKRAALIAVALAAEAWKAQRA